MNKFPTTTFKQQAVLVQAVLDLLDESNNSKDALQINGLEQHRSDLNQAQEKVWRALDPFMENGPECVETLVYGDLK